MAQAPTSPLLYCAVETPLTSQSPYERSSESFGCLANSTTTSSATSRSILYISCTSFFQQYREARAVPEHHRLQASSSAGLRRHQTLSRLGYQWPEPRRRRR